jgi:hypothetical protein
MTTSNFDFDAAAAESMRKSASAFKKLTEQARRDSKEAGANSLRLKLIRSMKEVRAQLESIYIHPSKIEGQELLRGHLPKRVIERAVADGGSIFGTEHPRLHWFVTRGSLEQSSVSLNVSMPLSTMNVYLLSELKENDVCRLIM